MIAQGAGGVKLRYYRGRVVGKKNADRSLHAPANGTSTEGIRWDFLGFRDCRIQYAARHRRDDYAVTAMLIS